MEITLKINNRTKGGKSFLEFLKTLAETNSWLEIPEGKDHPVSKNKPNAETLRILKKNDETKPISNKNAADMYQKLGINV